MRVLSPLLRALPCLLLAFTVVTPVLGADRVTVLYDAFGEKPNLKRDWGIALLVEVAGKKILFDTGNNPEVFAANVRALNLDLKSLDFVVISHRHGDHTSGLSYLLRVNPKIKIYVPAESFGPFGSSLPRGFYKSVDSLPHRMRYFDGEEPGTLLSGSAWLGANFVPIDAQIEVAPGIFLIPTVSKTPGTLELRELTLALQTPRGLVLVVGCSHSGIEEILGAAASIGSRIHMVIGGLHLVKASDAEIDRLAHALHDTWKLDRIAPGHCTGEPAFATLSRVFGEAYNYAGLGSVVEI